MGQTFHVKPQLLIPLKAFLVNKRIQDRERQTELPKTPATGLTIISVKKEINTFEEKCLHAGCMRSQASTTKIQISVSCMNFKRFRVDF